MSNLSELLLTVEKLRADKYPDLPAELIKRILEVEALLTDEADGVEAFKRVGQVVDKYVGEGVE